MYETFSEKIQLNHKIVRVRVYLKWKIRRHMKLSFHDSEGFELLVVLNEFGVTQYALTININKKTVEHLFKMPDCFYLYFILFNVVVYVDLLLFVLRQVVLVMDRGHSHDLKLL